MAQQQDDFDERLTNPPLIWAPKGLIEGMEPDRQFTEKKVAGVIEEKDVRENEFGIYPVVVVKLNDGRRVQVSGFSTVLKNRLAERDPKIGEKVGILYLGKEKSKRPGRKDYDNYNVVTESAGREVSFSKLAESDEESTGPSVTDDLGTKSTSAEPPENDPEHGESW